VEKFGFKGFVMSDWFAAQNIKDPANMINAGLSLEMPNAILYKVQRLQQSFAEKKFSEERLNEMMRRLLRIMIITGVLDKKLPKGSVNTPQHQTASRQIAESGITLLKNDNNLLPLNKSEIKTVAVLGANANKKFGKFLYGGSSAVIPPFEITPLNGLKRKCGGSIAITNDPSNSDITIIFTGLNHNIGNDSEAGDRKILELPHEEEELILSTIQKNPKIIVVLLNGSPIAMERWIDQVPAILEGWYPGMYGGDVLADAIFGDLNPSGKLPITFPKKLSDSPAHKSERTYPGIGSMKKENMISDSLKKVNIEKYSDNKVFYEEGIYVGYRHFDKNQIDPLFPFGFGLSYTTFEYQSYEIEKTTLEQEDQFKISVTLKNTGNRDGAEIVQVYYSDIEASVDRPVKELFGFEKVMLKADETKTIEINLQVSDLAFYDVDSQAWKVEPGQFKILIGASSRDIKFEDEITVN
jgi:beta-glucosidase